MKRTALRTQSISNLRKVSEAVMKKTLFLMLTVLCFFMAGCKEEVAPDERDFSKIKSVLGDELTRGSDISHIGKVQAVVTNGPLVFYEVKGVEDYEVICVTANGEILIAEPTTVNLMNPEDEQLISNYLDYKTELNSNGLDIAWSYEDINYLGFVVTENGYYDPSSIWLRSKDNQCSLLWHDSDSEWENY